MTFAHGQPIVRREVLRQGPWLGAMVHVVEDSPGRLVTFLPSGSPLGFPPGAWPTPDGRHPWHGKRAWSGHGTLMVQAPHESHAIWHFWRGSERVFAGWYVNLQEPFRRTAIGYDTQDLELDIWVEPDRTWVVKDAALLPVRVREGRFSQIQADAIQAYGAQLVERLARGETLWDPRWASWCPPADWPTPILPPDWSRVAWQHPGWPVPG